MNPVLVTIDVAAADLGKSVRTICELVDGGTQHVRGLAWVFNVASNPKSRNREMRFWRAELLAHAQGNAAAYGRFELAQVINLILPEKRANFHAGEVDQMFQFRPSTRIDLHTEIESRREGNRYVYPRATLARFLQRRWLGAAQPQRESFRRGLKEVRRSIDFVDRTLTSPSETP